MWELLELVRLHEGIQFNVGLFLGFVRRQPRFRIGGADRSSSPQTVRGMADGRFSRDE
jgi:hypothetical protein